MDASRFFTGILFLLAVVLGGQNLSAQSSYTDFEEADVTVFRAKQEFSYPKDDFSGSYNLSGTPNSMSGDSARPGEVLIDEPQGINRLLAIRENPVGDLEGFRVQIYAGGDLEKANETRADFLQLYREIPNYRLWLQPTFRVRVGDFINRNQAVIFSNEIREHFPGAFVVPDKIRRPKYRKAIDPEVLEKMKEEKAERLEKDRIKREENRQ